MIQPMPDQQPGREEQRKSGPTPSTLLISSWSFLLASGAVGVYCWLNPAGSLAMTVLLWAQSPAEKVDHTSAGGKQVDKHSWLVDSIRKFLLLVSHDKGAVVI